MTNQKLTPSARTAEKAAPRGAFGAGILVVNPATQSVLLGKRSALSPEPNTWAPFGGTSEDGEKPQETAVREHLEESGIAFEVYELTLLFATNRRGNFPFYTYVATVHAQIEPAIDLTETQAWGWFRATHIPKPVHPGFQELLNSEQWNDVLNLLSVYQTPEGDAMEGVEDESDSV